MWNLIAIAVALAGTISVESDNPVGLRVDGTVIDPGTTSTNVDGLSAGRHVVEITTLSGNVIDTYEVNLVDDAAVVELVVVNRRLQRALEAQDVERFAREFGPEPVGDAAYQVLLRKLVKGSSKKK